MEDHEKLHKYEYNTRDFWNNRFTEHQGAFDWYVGWNEMKTMITENFPVDDTSNVLMVGCGNSSKNHLELSESMAKNGYYVENMDISNVVLELMQKQTNQEYILMDATNMNFKDRSFDFLLDKGTFDALISNSSTELPRRLIREMARIANKGFVVVTYGKPSARTPLFQDVVSEFGDWEENYLQCELSLQSQLINIIRSSYPGENLASVVRTPEKLKKCLEEIAAYKANKQSSEKSLRQTHCWVYIYKRVISTNP